MRKGCPFLCEWVLGLLCVVTSGLGWRACVRTCVPACVRLEEELLGEFTVMSGANRADSEVVAGADKRRQCL